MTALEKWKNDFKEYISELSIPRDDYKGIMEYINEVPIEALEQQPCKDWHDVPSDEMTLEQARQAVKDLRKKLAEDLINQRATTCRHGGHCEWVACDKCNHYEPDVLNQQPCEDYISRAKAIEEADKLCLETDYDNEQVIEMLNDLPPVTPKEKTGHWKPIEYDGYADGYPVWDVWECSKCGLEHNGDKESLTAFCPDCGAKMVEPQESEVQK